MVSYKRLVLTIVTTVSCEAFSLASIREFINPDATIPWQTMRRVNIHPFRNHAPLPQHALHLHGLVDLATYGKLLLHHSNLPSQFEIVTRPQSRTALRYRFRLNGARVCDFEVALHSLPAGQVFYVGRLPIGNPQLLGLTWANHDEIQDLIAASFTSAEIISHTRCLLNTADGLLPVVDAEIIVEGLPYTLRMTADAILHQQRRFAHAKGKFEVYPENHVRNKKRERVEVEVDGSGYLDNDYFSTVSLDSNIARAYSADNEFIYPETDIRMAEVNGFVHANKMLDWFVEAGFEPSDKVIIGVNSSPYDLDDPYRNNAFYLPQQTDTDGNTTDAKIFLGRGDDIILRNLCNDGDVVAHELGHHIIYRYLGNFQADGGVLHEALADYFVYAKTNNPCLAESICPTGSPACYLNGKCLRSASTSLTYRDVQASNSPHRKGMVLSAALWNLRQHPDTSRTKIDTIIYDSMQYFLPDTDQRGFIKSLLAADYALFKGEHCKTIISSMRKRGYGWLLDDLSCARKKLAIGYERRIKADSEAEVEEDSDTYEYRTPACGTILPSSKQSHYVLILLAFAPLLIGIGIARRQM
ncbi:MAG: hypothetical protein OYH77_01460 [Pseudomonadota bacterium]|nr:hypothetical protein [Pseudomonadota bacterium]